MTIGEFGMLLVIVGSLPYMWLIVRGTVRPHRVSWFVWSVIMLFALLGYRASGAEDSIWFLVGDFAATTATFLLSLWRGVGGWTRLDVTCLAIATLSVALWQFSSIPVFVLWGALIADAIAVVPTLVKSWHHPKSEAASAYVFSALAALCGMIAVHQWNLTLLFYPAYLFLANAAVAVVIWVGRYRVSEAVLYKLRERHHDN